MISNINMEKYTNIKNICNYKISISKKIKWYIDNDNQNRYIDINEIYNCYKIVFDEDKLWPRYSYNISTSNMEFTIHHFIYYIVRMQSNAFKMVSSIIDDYDILEIYIINIRLGYEEHLNNLIYKLYDYLYPTGDINILPCIFISLKNMFNYIRDDIIMSKQNNSYFTTWDEYDLLSTLEYYINISPGENEVEYKNDLIGSSMYYTIMNDISNNKYTIKEFNMIIDIYNKKRNNERLKIYEEELIVKTWHPNRLINWCLDVDDKLDIGII